MSILSNGTHTIKSAGKAAVKDVVLHEPPPLEKLNWLIHLFHVRGETTPCKNLIQEEIINSHGKNEFAHYKNAVILREEGKVQEALEGFQICHKLNPENVDNFKEIGKCLFILKRYRLALDAYLEAERVSHKPDWEIYHNIGECYMHLKDMKKAKENAHRAMQLGTQEISYELLISILITEGDLKAAVSVCNAAVESCPDSVKMLTKSGILYLRIGENQHAFERLSSALALDSINPKALLGIGCITQNHKEYDVALSKYKIAVQSDTESVALWNNIGMCFYSKQKYIAAITCLKRALWLSPLNWRVLLNLGLVNLSTNQPASSFNFLCAAVNIRPDLGIPFMLLGCALLQLNDGENALRAMRQAIALNGEEPLITANTCLCLMLTGHHSAAFELVKRLKEIPEVQNNEMNALIEHLEDLLSQERLKENGPPLEPSATLNESVEKENENVNVNENLSAEDEV